MSIPVCIPAGRLKENERHALVPSNAMYGEIMLRYLSEAICHDRDFTGKFHFSGASAVSFRLA